MKYLEGRGIRMFEEGDWRVILCRIPSLSSPYILLQGRIPGCPGLVFHVSAIKFWALL